MYKMKTTQKLTQKDMVEAIEYFKNEHNLSYSKIAEYAKISRRTILRIQKDYNGEIKYKCNDETRTKLSKALHKLYRYFKK